MTLGEPISFCKFLNQTKLYESESRESLPYYACKFKESVGGGNL